jgi:tRNA dimethylallyltransferase
MDIGTAKPTPAERRAVAHHLVDVVEPDASYDAARFAREAAQAIAAIRGRGRWPVLVGVRAALLAEAQGAGAEALHRRLRDLDPPSAARLHPRDTLRVRRALEVALQTGEPGVQHGVGAWSASPAASPYRVVAIGLTMPRPDLYAALDARVDRMLADGLLDEVRALLEAGFDPSLPAMQGIGYRHLVPVVRDGRDLAPAVATMKRDTRRYAKRQWTWFLREPGVTWVETAPGHAGGALAEIKKIVESTRVFDYAD